MKKLEKIVRSLCDKDNEQEWFEFKENWSEPVQLGEYISALSNVSLYHSEENAYFIWGVNDKTHEIVGTTLTSTVIIIKSRIRTISLEIFLQVSVLNLKSWKWTERGWLY